MLPVRPCSSLAAASSARMAGGEPSSATTRYRFPAGGAVAFIAAKAIRFLARRPGIRHADGITAWLTRPGGRTGQFGRRLGWRGLLARGAALVMRAATYMAQLKLVMNTLAFTFALEAGEQPAAGGGHRRARRCDRENHTP